MIDEYIKQIFGYYPMVVGSWGIESCIPLMESEEEGEGGLCIRVNAYKFQGEVRIMLSWLDLFDVTLYNPDGTIKEQVTGIYVDNLVPVIDGLIERTDDYEERIKRDYGIVDVNPNVDEHNVT